MNNILTIDVEDWFHTNDYVIEKKYRDRYGSRIGTNLDMMLSILDEYEVKATFFMLGSVAKENPGLVRKIDEKGHVLGSHGYEHEMVTNLGPDKFRENLKKSCDTIEDITGKKITNYRAPSWSIDQSDLWALEILEEKGILVDSSMQPFRSPISGSRMLPAHPFHPVIGGKELKLLEIPSTVITLLGFRIPFSGGTYLRLLPENFTVWALKRINKKRPGMVYMHPWELDVYQPHIKSNYIYNISHYKNLDTTESKLRRLLSEFDFITLDELVSSNDFPKKKIRARKHSLL